MREEEVDHRVARLVGGGVEAELGEALVLPDEGGGRTGEQVEEARVGRAIERLLQVFDDVELDAALAQDVQRAARFASARVVIDQHGSHRALCSDVDASLQNADAIRRGS